MAEVRADDGVRRGWGATNTGCAWVVGAGQGNALGWLLKRFSTVALFEPRSECFDGMVAARERGLKEHPEANIVILPVGIAERLGAYADGAGFLDADMAVSIPDSQLPVPDFIQVRHDHGAFLAGARNMLRRDAPSLLLSTFNDNEASWAGSYVEAQGYPKISVVVCPRTKIRYVRAKSPTGRGHLG